MEGVFAEAAKLPHVSEVASPYASGGAGAISKDGEIAYATVQYDVSTDKIEKSDTSVDREHPGAMETACRSSGRQL